MIINADQKPRIIQDVNPYGGHDRPCFLVAPGKTQAGDRDGYYFHGVGIAEMKQSKCHGADQGCLDESQL